MSRDLGRKNCVSIVGGMNCDFNPLVHTRPKRAKLVDLLDEANRVWSA